MPNGTDGVRNREQAGIDVAAEHDFDTIIIGQGLAGTTLAWRLVEGGQRVRLFDPGHADTCSRIAAGLITPITGKNLALSPTFALEAAEAERFYRRIEARIGVAFYRPLTGIRLFQSVTEAAKWAGRAGDPAFAAHVLPDDGKPLIDRSIAAAMHGGFAMRSAQLDTARYLAASRQSLDVVTAKIDWSRDVVFEADRVIACGKPARSIVSCEGFAASKGNWSHLPFRAAKGEMIDIETALPLPDISLHHGIWVAPTATPSVSRVGATFAWDMLDQVPTASARTELETKLAAFFRMPFTVRQHRAAVRPIIGDGRPVVAAHPLLPRHYAFNGLASKGALRAPLAAQQLAAHLVDGVPLDAALVAKS